MDESKGAELLAGAREGGTALSGRSLDLLIQETPERRRSYVREHKDSPIGSQTSSITCMELLRKDSEAADAVSVLVVGTEDSHVYFLPPDPSDCQVLCKVRLPSPPVMLNVGGLFDVEWRVVVACRDGKVYSIRNDEVRGSAVLSAAAIECGSLAVALCRQDKNIVLASVDRQLGVYSARGKRVSGMQLSDCATEMCVVQSRRANSVSGLLVALASGEIRLYKGSVVLHSFKVERPVHAMRFGPYGREDNSLVIVHGASGALTIKILRRLFDLDASSQRLGALAEQEVPLQVPRKTRLFVEQTQREREQAVSMHAAFQSDLCKLRLQTARAYVKTLTDGSMVSATTHSDGPAIVYCV